MKRNSFTVGVWAVFGILAVLALLSALLGGDQARIPILQALQPQRALALSATMDPRPIRPSSPLTTTGSGFTYQGRLKDGGSPANGQYDIVFTLFDAPSAGNQVGSPSV